MDNSKQAFPIPYEAQAGGLTLREYAAVAAMQGILASSVMMPIIIDSCNGEDSAPVIAQMSVDVADALIAKLEEGE